MHLQSLKFIRPTVKKEIHFQENRFFDLTHNVAHFFLHYVTTAPAKFEVATSNGLGGDAFTKEKNII